MRKNSSFCVCIFLWTPICPPQINSSGRITCWCMCFLSNVDGKTAGVEAACAVLPKPRQRKVVFVIVNRIIVLVLVVKACHLAY